MINIDRFTVSSTSEPFIVAEAGINHNGDLRTAMKMVDVAKQAGVSAIKFQTFKAAEFCGDPEQKFTYQSQGQEVTENMLDMFKRMELAESEWGELSAYCKEQDILFLSTPQNLSDLEFLRTLDLQAIKVGSDDFTNLPLIRAYAETQLPLILSCGMADMGEVHQALETAGALDGAPVILCLCTSRYPTPAEDVNLEKLRTLSAAYPFLTLGFSDHTQGPLASSLAVAYGAAFFEKHFTLDHDLPGPDHWFSENPESLAVWVNSIKQAYVMRGSAIVRPSEEEIEMRTLARRSLVALQDIKEGEVLDADNLGLRRPGNGLPPSLFEHFLGLRAARDISQGDLISAGDARH